MKRLLFLLLLIPVLSFGQEVYTYGGKAVTYGGEAVRTSVYCAEYQAVYDAYTTKPSDAVAAIDNTMVSGLVSDGVWAKLDVVWVYASHTNGAGEALLDWKQPTGGTDIVTDGTFDTDCGVNWTCGTGWAIAGGVATHTGSSSNISANNVFTNGKTYKISLRAIRTGASSYIRVYAGDGSYGDITPGTLWGDYEVILTAAGNNQLIFRATIDGCSIDDVSVVEWTNATAYNAPTFTAFEGFTGADTKYIDCNWNPSVNGVNYTQNSASQIIYVRTDIAHLNTRYGVSGSADGKNIFIMPRRSESPTKAAIETNDNTQIYTADAVSGDGMLINTRTAAAVNKLYRNKVTIINATTTSTGIPTFSPYCLAGNDDGEATNFRPDQVSLYAFGAGLTQTDVNNITDRFETRMDALGKGIIAYVDPITDPLGDLLKLQYLALQLRLKQHENAFFNPAP